MLNLFNSSVLTVITTYGLESWIAQKVFENTLNTFEKILGILWGEFKTKKEGREIAQRPYYISNIMRKKGGSIIATLRKDKNTDYQRQCCFGDQGGKEDEEDYKQSSKEHCTLKKEQLTLMTWKQLNWWQPV